MAIIFVFPSFWLPARVGSTHTSLRSCRLSADRCRDALRAPGKIIDAARVYNTIWTIRYRLTGIQATCLLHQQAAVNNPGHLSCRGAGDVPHFCAGPELLGWGWSFFCPAPTERARPASSGRDAASFINQRDTAPGCLFRIILPRLDRTSQETLGTGAERCCY